MADEVFVGSHEKSYTKVPGAKGNASGYGQNGSTLPSSTAPGDPAKGNIPGVSTPTPSADAGDWQTRKVNAKPIAPAHGMKGPASGAKVPSANVRKSRTDGVARPVKR